MDEVAKTKSKQKRSERAQTMPPVSTPTRLTTLNPAARISFPSVTSLPIRAASTMPTAALQTGKDILDMTKLEIPAHSKHGYQIRVISSLVPGNYPANKHRIRNPLHR